MKPTISAVRAVSSVYAKSLLKPLLLIGLGVYGVAMALIVWIAYAVSPWWLLLAIIPTVIIVVGLLAWLIVWILAIRLAPSMNGNQRRAADLYHHPHHQRDGCCIHAV